MEPPRGPCGAVGSISDAWRGARRRGRWPRHLRPSPPTVAGPHTPGPSTRRRAVRRSRPPHRSAPATGADAPPTPDPTGGADHQQRSPRPDGRGQRREQSGPRPGCHLHELGRDEVEGVRLGCADEKVDLLPLDARRDYRISVRGVPGGPLERHPRDVSRHHVPTVPGEPDGVGPLATPHVERPPGRQTATSATSCGLGLPLQTCGDDR